MYIPSKLNALADVININYRLSGVFSSDFSKQTQDCNTERIKYVCIFQSKIN